MKKCSLCGSDGPFGMRDGRPETRCKACNNARVRRDREKRLQRAASVPPDARPTPPAVPTFEAPLEPLVQAYTEYEAAKERRDVKREHKALVEENTKLKGTIAEMIRAAQPPTVHVYSKAEEHRADAIACAQLSDWHVEEPVTRESVHGLNEFSPEIAHQRSALYFRNLLRLTDIVARDSEVKTIYISMKGDIITGWIHDEMVANNTMAPGDAARYAQGLLISGIDFLLRESQYSILIDAIPGNHGRMTEKMSYSDPTGTSIETFMYHSIAGRYFDNPRVSMHVAPAADYYRTFFERFVVRGIHGYEIQYQGGVGGLTIPLNKWLYRSNTNIKANLTLVGHFHQRLDGNSFLVNGSLIGYNTYAMRKGFGFEPPAQNFFAIQARNGGERGVTAPIWCTPDSRKAS